MTTGVIIQLFIDDEPTGQKREDLVSHFNDCGQLSGRTGRGKSILGESERGASSSRGGLQPCAKNSEPHEQAHKLGPPRNPLEQFDLAALAAESGYRYTGFIHAFRAQTKLSPCRYIVRQRPKHAKRLMRNRSLTPKHFRTARQK
jgi:AraC-like DNA-binding protein